MLTVQDSLLPILTQKFSGTPIQIVLGTTASTQVELDPGHYRIVADGACYVLHGATGIASSLSSSADGVYLPEGLVDSITIDEDDRFITALVKSGTATLHLLKQR